MNRHVPHPRKIDPAALRPDGTPDDDNRVEIGPTPLAFAEWAEAGLQAPDLAAMRAFRLARIMGALSERDWAGVLLFNPLNIRYATDTTNMQLWNAHNPFRATLVCADGHMVLWDYKCAPFLAGFNPLVSEVRPGPGMYYFGSGDRTEDDAAAFASDISELLRTHAGGNTRLGVDKIQIAGLRALEARGLDIMLGEEAMEKARVIKGPDEIRAMRCAMHACEASVRAMERAMAPGMTENDIWAVLHAENIRRGGEWIETRLLASGPRTNPWFQECGPRVVQNNEIIGLDTDMVGCYGMCADISRTFWLGDGAPRADMIEDYRLGWEHIEHNMALLRPGLSMADWVAASHPLPQIYQKQKYSCFAHGVGLCDEYPMAEYPDAFRAGAFDMVFEPGMCLCIEALISREGGDFSIKLEDQVVITETGVENTTRYPRDPALMGGH
ncbi:dimethylsulfonioproprionate lyase DddP [Oceanibium sediminis]|uniref:dimethylsulfonioproprionate lyase DddP n=1 Tax=Oceanibium sediminis TaxID=2026339 RepID=UPI000DD4A09E|nr:dimethylsulfonioproprionate lyase DddP [Oceanibium sediminis]